MNKWGISATNYHISDEREQFQQVNSVGGFNMDFQSVWLRRAASFFSDDTALVFGDRRKSFKEVNDRVSRLSNALADLGIKKGDRVAFLERNSDHFIEIRYALQKRGFVEVPLETRAAPQEHIFRILNAGAETLIFNDRFHDIVKDIRPELKGLKNLICLEGEGKPIAAISYEDLIEQSSPSEPGVLVEADDLQSIRYTSGTTGTPKSVMRTYRNSMAIAMYLLFETGMSRNDRILHVLPLDHMTFLYTGPAFKLGACQVILDKTDPESILGTIEKEEITLTSLVPTLIYRLVNTPKVTDYDLSSLRSIHYAGSCIPSKTLRDTLALFGPIFVQYYGLTECAGYVTVLRAEEHIVEQDSNRQTRLASCGRPNSVLVRIVKEDGSEARPGEKGEILLKGSSVTTGYWNDPKRNKEKIVDGWLHTGDMATTDDEGFIYILDRKDDMIVTGGFNVYPMEVENVIADHPSVEEVGVVGIPDEKWGEAVKAFVVLKSGKRAREKEIIEHCTKSAKNLASYKKPKSVEFVDSLPKTPTGKTLRRKLREMVKDK
jgi:long-chain acyl-CoA synthetase